MKIARCEKCGGYAPEGFILCPSCMSESGEEAASAAMELLNVINIISIGDTNANRRAAIESILIIKSRLEGNAFETKEKTQTPP